MEEENVSSNKRKRMQNTNTQQYLLYLEEMENDYIFRSGTIDPTVEPGYLSKKWNELSVKLNAVGKGPALDSKTWQKRFKDWKNATRAKYRKINEDRVATGGGLPEKIELSPLEERGLHVWGKIAVTGSPLINITGGLSSESTNIDVSEDISTFASELNETILINNVENIENNLTTDTTKINAPKTKPKLQKPKSTDKIPRNKLPNLQETAIALKDSYDAQLNILENISNKIADFTNIYAEVHRKKNRLEETRLKFEIEKYKYENVSFNFSFNGTE